MIKSKIEKIGKLIDAVRKMNGKFIPITYYENDNIYQYEGKNYKTIEELKRINKVSEFDTIKIITIKFV